MAVPSRFVAPNKLTSLADAVVALQAIQEQLDSMAPSARQQLFTKNVTLRAGEFIRISPRQSQTLFAKLPKASADNFGDTIEISLERPNGTLRLAPEHPDTVSGMTFADFTVATRIELQSNGTDQWVLVNQISLSSPAAVQGPIGPMGDAGQDGQDGQQGVPGPAGLQGLPGTPGRDGIDGQDGSQGPPGIRGVPGPAGPMGLDGADGADGALIVPGWAASLVAGRASGGTNPQVSAGQYLQLGADTGLPTIGDIRKGSAGTFNISGGADISINGAGDATLSGSTTATVAANTVNVTGATDVNITASTGEVNVNAVTGVRLNDEVFVDSGGTSGGTITIAERSAAAPTPGAGQGCLWVDNLAPTELHFVDDENCNWPLNVHTVDDLVAIQAATNATTVLTGASATIPADSWRVGTTYKLEAYIVYSRGATATAQNTVVNITLNGTNYATATITNRTAAGGGACRAIGYITCLSTGGAGTFIANVQCPNDFADVPALANVGRYLERTNNTAASATTQDTTTALALSITANMSAAVASTTLTITNAILQKVS